MLIASGCGKFGFLCVSYCGFFFSFVFCVVIVLQKDDYQTVMLMVVLEWKNHSTHVFGRVITLLVVAFVLVIVNINCWALLVSRVFIERV